MADGGGDGRGAEGSKGRERFGRDLCLLHPDVVEYIPTDNISWVYCLFSGVGIWPCRGVTVFTFEVELKSNQINLDVVNATGSGCK